MIKNNLVKGNCRSVRHRSTEKAIWLNFLIFCFPYFSEGGNSSYSLSFKYRLSSKTGGGFYCRASQAPGFSPYPQFRKILKRWPLQFRLGPGYCVFEGFPGPFFRSLCNPSFLILYYLILPIL